MSRQYGLIFDVDGVIADTEAVNARATIQVFADLLGIYGVRRQDFEAGLGRGAESYIRAAARVHNTELTDEQVSAAVAARQDTFLEILADEPLDPFPGVTDLITAALERDDFRTAIATSSTRRKSEAVLRSTGVPYERMAYITGDDVNAKKPAPELFLAAARAINLPPVNCTVIEDAPDGVQAAHAARCRCIAVTNSTTAERLSTADLVVATLAAVSLDDIVMLTDAETR